MEIKNCPRCKRLFEYSHGLILCPNCKRDLEKRFFDVKDYLRKNRHATISEVCKATEVDSRQIRQWIKEERLILSRESSIMLECEMCGAPIRTGKYCPECKHKTVKDLKALNSDERRSSSDKSKKDVGLSVLERRNKKTLY